MNLRPPRSTLTDTLFPYTALFRSHAGLSIARLDGPLYGGRATPARQQAGVDVEATVRRPPEHPLRQDPTIGGHHNSTSGRGMKRLLRPKGLIRVFAVQAAATGVTTRDTPTPTCFLDRPTMKHTV